MGNRNPYNRDYDNDREPIPEETLKTRLKYRLTVLREDFEEFTGFWRRLGSGIGQRLREGKESRAVRRAAMEARRAASAEKQRAEGEDEESAQAGAGVHYAPPPRNTGDGLFSSPSETVHEQIFSDVDPLTGRKRRKIELTSRFPIYLVIWVVALFFTQALRSRASNIFIGFITVLPIVLLLYALSARLSLSMSMMSDQATIEKNQPYTYQLRLINSFVIPYPFVEALMIIPQSNSVRSTERSVFLSMNPMSKYDVRNEVRFRFRGTYHIGVNCFYVYDFFRILRVRVDIRNYTTVSVLPRKLYMGEGKAETTSDAPDRTRRSPYAFDKLEVSDIRDYRPGDPLKSIHWNLSSKAEDLIVKDYNTGASKMTYVYCDLSARFPEEPPVLPRETRRERRLHEREEKERQRLLAMREKENLRRKKKRLPELPEEEILTSAERRAKRLAGKQEEKRKRDLARLANLAKTDAKKADALRSRIYREDRKRAKAETERLAAEELLRQQDQPDLQLLAKDSHYEDMNEYCADGVIELTVATVLRELRAGNEVVLFWYDSRSAAGAFAYSLRDPGDLQTIYRLFATAPLCGREKFVVKLSTLAEDISGLKQIYVTSAIDEEAVTAFCNMPSAADGAAFGSSEILLYDPEERFAYPELRRAYIAGCTDGLAQKGFRLVRTNLSQLHPEGGDA